jgi:Ca2+-transporting ATPase
MTSPPRKQEEHMLNRNTMFEVLLLGFLMGALAFANFVLFMGRTGAELTTTHVLYSRATTLSYATIVLCQFANILSRRYNYDSLFNRDFWSNKKILWSIVISIGLTLTVIYTPSINRFLGFAPLTVSDWISVLAAAAIFLLAHEIIKAVKRSRRRVYSKRV